MANYANLIAAIKAVVKQNGTNDITGQAMQDVLVTMTNTIGRFAAFAGTAMPSTNPNNPDQTVYYLTSIPGTYANFGGITVPPDRLVALHNIEGAWKMLVLATFGNGSVVPIDPALDPDSVNPVENRVITGAINGLDSRVTALEGTLGLTIKQEFLSVAQAEALNGMTYLGKTLLACNFQAAGIYGFTFFNPIQVATGDLYMIQLRTGTTFYANVSYVHLTRTVSLADIIDASSSIEAGNNWVIYAE